MSTATVNGVRLFYQLGGSGDVPLVLVHGSWGSHEAWIPVVAQLSASYRVLTYDRRGHSRSERPRTQGSVREDVADLAALIEELGLAPAWVVGNSFGASITLRLAGDRPDLLRGVIVHEPPLFALLAEDPTTAPMLEALGPEIATVVERILAGDHAGAAEHFIDTVALGPGSWAELPPEIRETLIENAPTFLDESRDPEALVFDRAWLESFPRRVLLTKGDQSPPIFAPVIDKLADAGPNTEVVTFADVGHIPQVTHPEMYARVITAFIEKDARVTSRRKKV